MNLAQAGRIRTGTAARADDAVAVRGDLNRSALVTRGDAVAGISDEADCGVERIDPDSTLLIRHRAKNAVRSRQVGARIV